MKHIKFKFIREMVSLNAEFSKVILLQLVIISDIRSVFVKQYNFFDA